MSKKRKPSESTSESESDQLYDFIKANFNTPIKVEQKDDVMKISLFRDNNSCNDSDAEIFPKIIQQLQYNDQACGGDRIIYGFSGEVSIAKVRGNTFDSFCRALLLLVEKSSLNGYSFLKPIVNVALITTVKKNSDLKFIVNITRELNFTFEYSSLRNIFETRTDLENSKTAESDRTMIKILALLNHIIKNHPGQSDFIQKIICSIGLVAAAKQVLDIGALYAILEPTFHHNQSCHFKTTDIENRMVKFDALRELSIDSVVAFINHAYANVNTLPKNAILETADGSASTIAGTYFTILSDTSKGLSRPTPFMNVDRLFRIIITLINDDNFKEYVLNVKNYETMVRTPTTKFISSITSITTKINILKGFYNIETLSIQSQAFIIDIFYSLIDTMYSTIPISGEQYNNLFNMIIAMTQTNYIPITVSKQEFFHLFSVSKFLYTSKQGIDHMKNLLMACNFDSQCHDNGKCQYYRLLCIYYFLLYCNDPAAAWNMLTGRYDYFVLQSIINVNELKQEVITKYGGNQYGGFENFANYLDLLLVNFEDNRKILFYALADKEYKDIEKLLNQRMIHNCDIVLSERGTQNIFVLNPFRGFGQDNYGIVSDEIGKIQMPYQGQIAADIIPKYAHIAIDLSIHWTVSALKDVKGASMNTSELLFTPVSYIDAASNRMFSTATYLNDPVKMLIYPYTTNTNANSGYTFIKSLAPKTNILDPYENDAEKITDNYSFNFLIKNLRNESFGSENVVQSKVNEFLYIYNNFKPIIQNSEGIRTREFGKKLNDIEFNKLHQDTRFAIENLFTSITTLMTKEGDKSIENFREIFKDYATACQSFYTDRNSDKKTKKPIKSFKFPDIIETLAVDLVNFFKNNTNEYGIYIINANLYIDYYNYLFLLINAIRSSNTGISYTLYKLLENKDLLEDKEPNTKRLKKGGTVNSDKILTLSDFTGRYGSHFYINDHGTFSIEPINTPKKLTELQNKLKEIYKIKDGVVKSPGKKSQEWWTKTGDFIRNNNLFKIVPPQQKEKKYVKIIENVLKNVKTIKNDENAITKSIQDVLKPSPHLRTGLSHKERKSIMSISSQPMPRQSMALGGLTKRIRNKNIEILAIKNRTLKRKTRKNELSK